MRYLLVLVVFFGVAMSAGCKAKVVDSDTDVAADSDTSDSDTDAL